MLGTLPDFLIAPSIPASALSLPDASFAPLICHYCVLPLSQIRSKVVHTRLGRYVLLVFATLPYPSLSPAVLDSRCLPTYYLPTCPLLPLPTTTVLRYCTCTCTTTTLPILPYISNRRACASHSARTGRCIGVKHPLTIHLADRRLAPPRSPTLYTFSVYCPIALLKLK